MDLNLVYKKTKEFISDKWFNISNVVFVIWIVSELIGKLLGVDSSTGVKLVRDAVKSGHYAQIFQELFTLNFKLILQVFVRDLIVSLLLGAFTIALFKAVLNNTKVRMEDFLISIKTYFKPLLVSSTVTILITTLLGIIPIVGTIINVVLMFAFSFVTFLIADETTNDGFESVKLSLKETKGYKLDMLKMLIHYLWMPVMLLLGSILVMFLLIASVPDFAMLLMGIGLVAFVISSYYNITLAFVASVVFYNETKN